MTELIQEFVDSRGVQLRVDQEAGVLRGVKLLGLVSVNGRRYREKALTNAVGLYESAKVNVNHPEGNPLAPRDYRDRLGSIRKVEFRKNEGLFGELHFNPKHALAEQLVWDAENASQNVGFSHNVLARVSREENETVVEEITQVQSVDLVADPATTRGLFEQAKATGNKPDALTVEALELHHPDLLQEIRREPLAEVKKIRQQLDELKLQETFLQRDRVIETLLRKHKLPCLTDSDSVSKSILGDVFLETLSTANDPAQLETLIEERAKLVCSAGKWLRQTTTSTSPMSREVIPLSGMSHDQKQCVTSGKELAEMLLK